MFCTPLYCWRCWEGEHTAFALDLQKVRKDLGLLRIRQDTLGLPPAALATTDSAAARCQVAL